MYHFTESGRPGTDILYVTPAGQKAGIPKGVIIPAGSFYDDWTKNAINKWRRDSGRNGRPVYHGMVLHHSEDANCLLTIRPATHYVNRFGYFFSFTDPFKGRDADYDIVKGSLRRATIEKVEELDKYM